MSDRLVLVIALSPAFAFLIGFALGLWIGRHPSPAPTHD